VGCGFVTVLVLGRKVSNSSAAQPMDFASH
jgi:hypothetical protein